MTVTASLRTDAPSARFDAASIAQAVFAFRRSVEIVPDATGQQLGLRLDGDTGFGDGAATARLTPIYPEWLGDRGFLDTHAVRFPYIVGEMARGIATAEMVIAAGRRASSDSMARPDRVWSGSKPIPRGIAAALDNAGRSWGQQSDPYP